MDESDCRECSPLKQCHLCCALEEFVLVLVDTFKDEADIETFITGLRNDLLAPWRNVVNGRN